VKPHNPGKALSESLPQCSSDLLARRHYEYPMMPMPLGDLLLEVGLVDDTARGLVDQHFAPEIGQRVGRVY
jgi:predicted AAA+ superfamily ATPase